MNQHQSYYVIANEVGCMLEYYSHIDYDAQATVDVAVVDQSIQTGDAFATHSFVTTL